MTRKRKNPFTATATARAYQAKDARERRQAERETLKREATETANRRGHTLTWENFSDKWALGSCDCGAEVTVRTNPLPNEIDIGGDAVAINHPS